MGQTDFYILPTSTDLLRFTCQLANKIWKKGNTIHIHTQSVHQTEDLDDLLWTFQDTGFLPHERMQNDQHITSPVTIGWEAAATKQQVLINLSNQIPDFIASFARIAEVIESTTEAQLEIARHNYARYRKKGFTMQYHLI